MAQRDEKEAQGSPKRLGRYGKNLILMALLEVWISYFLHICAFPPKCGACVICMQWFERPIYAPKRESKGNVADTAARNLSCFLLQQVKKLCRIQLASFRSIQIREWYEHFLLYGHFCLFFPGPGRAAIKKPRCI